MRVRYTPEAFADRERIFEYLGERSRGGVRNVMASIREAVTLLTISLTADIERTIPMCW